MIMPVSERDALLPSSSSSTSEATSGAFSRLAESVDPKGSDAALTWQCMIAGAADAASFGQTGTWVGFMTGNVTQLTIAATTMALTHPVPEPSLNRFMLSSSALGGFIVGSLCAAALDTRFHGQHRGKLVFSALVRGVVFAAIALWLFKNGWKAKGTREALFAMSACMGSMAVSATRVGTTPFSTTVVFTSSIASLFSDQMLPTGLSAASRTRAQSIVALIVGGAVSQAVMIFYKDKLGSALAIGLTAVLELFCAIAWYSAKPLHAVTL